ncbi:MAG: hypothetical protein A3K66_03000 [Euryarchaeota archaeon RBG_16_67_27]|nr:MAG: hypothetical protein A3K66_03000 [Euryarchaeota archaeon RBG_16_67_27]
MSSLFLVAIASTATSLNSETRTFTVEGYADAFISTYTSEPQGTQPLLYVTRDNGQVNWSLLLFNIVGRLKPGDLVAEARIRLATGAASETGWPAVLVTGRILTSWDESKVTLKTKPLITYDTRTMTYIEKRPDVEKPIWVDVTKQLHRWHSYGGPSNFGTVLSFASDNDDVSIAFASRENLQYKGPQLQVFFKPGIKSIYGYAIDANALVEQIAKFE